MIVADASLVVDALLSPGAAFDRVENVPIAAPELLDAEVANAFRRRVVAQRIVVEVADAAIESYLALAIERYSHLPLLRRAWELRHNTTVYDGLYIALAEMLDVPLVTRDVKLVGIPGTAAQIEIVGGR